MLLEWYLLKEVAMAYYRWFFNPFTTEEIDKYVFRRSKGELGFKIVRIRYNDKANSLMGYAVLWIPRDVKIGHYTNKSKFRKKMNKKRTELALVLDIIDVEREGPVKSVKTGFSPMGIYYGSEDFVYTVGATVEPEEDFSPMCDDCSSGIHYFGTPEEAEQFCEWEFDKQLMIPRKHILDHLKNYYEMISEFHSNHIESFRPEDNHKAMEELVKFERAFYDKTNSYLTDYIVEIDEDGNSYYINHWEDAGHE